MYVNFEPNESLPNTLGESCNNMNVLITIHTLN